MTVTSWRDFGRWVALVWDTIKAVDPGPTARIRFSADGYADAEREERPFELDVTFPVSGDLGSAMARALDAAIMGAHGDGGTVVQSKYEDASPTEAAETEVLDRGDLDALIDLNLGDFSDTPPTTSADAAETEVGGELLYRTLE